MGNARLSEVRPVLRSLMDHYVAEPARAGFLADESENADQQAFDLVRNEILHWRRRGKVVSAEPWLTEWPDEQSLLDRLFSVSDESSVAPNSTVIAERPGSTGSLGSTVPEVIVASDTALRLGRYELREQLGQGGFGTVWLALDPALNRQVAIKTMRPDKEWSADQMNEFLAEGRRLAQLRHPGIVSVFDVGVDNGNVFIVSEYIEGGTLERWLKKTETRTPERGTASLELIAAVADALHAAHAAGIVHRDVKPSNILLDAQGRPHLADFGVAASQQEQLEERASTLGTMPYMAPEQLRGDSHLADGRADIYSLGVILYRMLTGTLPFQAQGLTQYREAVLYREPRPPRSLAPEVDPRLEQICLKCLAKETRDRYTSAIDLVRDLQALSEVRQPGAVPSNPKRYILAVTVALLSVVSGVVYVTVRQPAGIPEPGNNPNDAPQVAVPALQPPAPAVPQLAVRSLKPSENPNEVADFNITDEGQLLKVYSENFLPVQIGEVGQDFDFEVGVAQGNWDGGFGLFFGYGLTTDRTQYQFQTFLLEQLLEGNHRLGLGRFDWSPMTSFAVNRDLFAVHDIPRLKAGAKTMSVHVRNGELDKVTFDGAPLDDLVREYRERRRGPAQFAGTFGVWCRNSSVVLTNPRLNGRTVHFSKP